MIDTIDFNGKEYPKFQASGNAARFAMPFALEVCKGIGLDIGCNREEWKFPGAFAVDPALNEYDAMNLPTPLQHGSMQMKWNYIFSSHCLEHLYDWVSAIRYWHENIQSCGVIFLYLPHPDQEYWKPWNNRKHVNILYPQDVADCLRATGFKKVFVSERDLNHSFIVMGEKA
jgi:hypothetical protein